MIADVALDADTVTHAMAARLSTCLLGHVLFLKNQVPFPVVQLARMPESDSPSRAAKKRQELMASFDTLASHLYTTFIALSTSLALRATDKTNDTPPIRTGRAFMAIVLGPTVGAAKARVILAIDGFEVKVWGMREDGALDGPVGCDAEESDKDEEGESDESSSEDGRSSGHSSPLSRSPSPSLSTSSSLSSPASPPPPSSSSSSTSSSSEVPEVLNPHVHTTTTSQDPFHTAERLLSRTLASACADDTSGQGLASEMAPTHTHILIRAPRRFTHPSWTPRQNISRTMDTTLEAFLCESREVACSEDVDVSTSTRGMGVRKQKKRGVEGVWIRARGVDGQDGRQGEDRDEEVAEEDEWIWWSWDGKLVGFADW
ncbi:hypothetical protein V8B97DRAFT_2009570 [Scleroderma yunnanense]